MIMMALIVGGILLGALLMWVVLPHYRPSIHEAKALSVMEEEASHSSDANAELLRRLEDVEKKLVALSASPVPISTAFQTQLVDELTHFHTPEMDALLAKLGPPFTLTTEEEARLEEMLKQRSHDMGDQITSEERDAAMILPIIMKRVRNEAAASPDHPVTLKTVEVPAKVEPPPIKTE